MSDIALNHSGEGSAAPSLGEGQSGAKTRVFLSYSRKDGEVVARIAGALQAHGGFHVFKDTEDILPTEEWRKRLEGLIGAADTIVFCLSPDSAASEVCAWEVEFAESLNKRIAPIVLREVQGQVPGGLAKLNYIFATARDDFDKAFASLVAALTTDIAWIREHTRLGELARRWQAGGDAPHQLLRGRDIDLAEQWARYRPANAPELTETLRKFVSASRAEAIAAARRARRTRAIGAALALLLVGGGIGWWKQDILWEQYQWRVVMKPSVLTPEQEKEKAAKPGPRSAFAECANGCPTMIVVPAGKFMMGSPEGQGDPNEHPQHEVTIPKPFAVSRTEITFAQWDICVAAGACPRVWDNAWGRNDRPVILVSWDEAKLYVAWLSKLTGKEYRLLSEAEWEYAARAGNPGKWSFGDDEGKIADYAWFSNITYNKTQPVAKKKPNGFGLYDMHGNVWEWVEDCWNGSYADKPDELRQSGRVWRAGNCQQRFLRGGSWYNHPVALRSAFRCGDCADDLRDGGIGFRVGRTLDR